MKLSTYFLASLSLIFLTACQSSKEGKQMDHAYTNQLIHTNSPYLLQHAHNPVDWYPWGDEALAKAKEENKMLLVSIGYSACHWCHVMEHESFEDTTVARIMNEHFVNIKIDREERPDIDAIYMTACQMSSETSCGWPLNSFALPDGRPVWSGTYFPKKQWVEILEYFIDIREKTPEKLEEFGDKLAAGMQSLEEIKPVENVQAFLPEAATKPLQQFLDDFDHKYGGREGVQKFPMPSNYEWLLQSYLRTGNEEALKAARLTLDQMANGGIYDQVGGGFSRYATDTRWRVPHFEKMLYDNSQLVSLYAKAYQVTQHAPYLETMEETLDFIARELTNPDGGFYSSLDADSEGEEGKFYVWTQAEIDSILSPTEAQLATKYYEVSKRGNWEEGKNILRVEKDLADVAESLSTDLPEAQNRIATIKEKLLAARAERVRPGLDDKILTSWNAMMLEGYVNAFKATAKEEYRQIAIRNGDFLSKHMLQSDFRLQRNFKDGSTSINGFLEDYAHTIAAFTALYEITFDESWLEKAKGLADYSIAHFQDEKSGFFFYTSDLDPPLLVRKIELSDNVIPASNSAMARSLLHLGHYFYDRPYLEIAEKMMSGMREKALEGESASFYSNWNQLYLELANPIYEVAIVGQSYDQLRQEIQAQYFPQAVYLGGANEGSLELLESKLVEEETFVYVCLNKVCKLPVTSAEEAKTLIK